MEENGGTQDFYLKISCHEINNPEIFLFKKNLRIITKFIKIISLLPLHSLEAPGMISQLLLF